MFKPLLRTLPTLSGNFTINCKLKEYNKESNNEYSTYIRLANLSTLQNFLANKDFNINLLNGKYEHDISKYYNYYSNVFYSSNFNYNKNNFAILDLNSIYNYNNDAYNKDYEFGCKRINYSQTGYQFNFYAPFYIDNINDIPEYFCIFIKIHDNLTKKIKININKDNKRNYLKNYLSSYINKIDERVIFCMPESLQATYFGIDVKKGGLSQYKDNIFGKLYISQTTINNFDYTICKGFSRNGLIMRQIIPLSFSFNINDIFNNYEREFFYGKSMKIYGYYFDKYDIPINMYDFDINYINSYNKYLKYNEYKGIYELDNGSDDKDNIINIMNVGYPSLNEAKYTKYEFTNKITPMYCKFKLLYSNDINPYITNISFGYSYSQYPNQKYGNFPTMFKGIFPKCVINNEDMKLPIGLSLIKYYKKYSQANYDKYIKLMTNYYSNWYTINDYNPNFNDETFINKLFNGSYWSDVKYGYTYHNGIIYDLSKIKNLSIDKFGVFMGVNMKSVKSNNFIEANLVLSKNDNFYQYDNSYDMVCNNENLIYYKKIYDLSSGLINNDYIKTNQYMIEDIHGTYIVENNYKNENIYYKLNTILNILKKHNIENEILILLEKRSITGYQLINNYHNINFFEYVENEYSENNEKQLIFEDLLYNYNNANSDNYNSWLAENLYVCRTGNTNKVKLSTIYNNLSYDENFRGNFCLFIKDIFISKYDIIELLKDKREDISNFSNLYQMTIDYFNFLLGIGEDSNINPFNSINNENIKESLLRKLYRYDEFTGKDADILNSNENLIINILYNSNLFKSYIALYMNNININNETIANETIVDNAKTLLKYNQLINHYIFKSLSTLLYLIINEYDGISVKDISYYESLNIIVANNIYTSIIKYLSDSDIYEFNPIGINNNLEIDNYFVKSYNINQNIYVDSYNLNNFIKLYNNSCNNESDKIPEININYNINYSFFKLINIENKFFIFNDSNKTFTVTIKDKSYLLKNDKTVKELNVNDIVILNKYNYKFKIESINNVIINDEYYYELVLTNYGGENIEEEYNDIKNKCSAIKNKYAYLELFDNNNIEEDNANDILNDGDVNYDHKEAYIKFIDKKHILDYGRIFYSDENKSVKVFYNILDSIYVKNRYLVFGEANIYNKDLYIPLYDYLIDYIKKYIEYKYKSINNTSEFIDGIANTNDLILLDNLIYLYHNSNTYILNWLNENLSENRNNKNNFELNLFGLTLELNLCYKKSIVLLNNNLRKLLDHGYFLYLYIFDNIDNYNYDDDYSMWKPIKSSELFNKKNYDFKDIYDYMIPLYNDVYLNDNDTNTINQMINIHKISNDNKYIINDNKYFKEIDIDETAYINLNNDFINTWASNLYNYDNSININKLENDYIKYCAAAGLNQEDKSSLLNFLKNNDDKDIYYKFIRSLGIILYSTNNSIDIEFDKLKDILIYDDETHIYKYTYNDINYAFYWVNLTINNSNSSFNIFDDYNINVTFNSINNISINDDIFNEYLKSIFYLINPFLKINIFNEYSKYINNIIYPYECEIDINYINSLLISDTEKKKYKILLDNDDDKIYDNIIKSNKSRKIKLLRYFNYITPYLKKTDIINDVFKLKFIGSDNNFKNIEKHNIFNKKSLNINNYEGIEYYNGNYSESEYEYMINENTIYDPVIIKQYEYKYFNDNLIFNLPEEIVIKDDKTYTADDLDNLKNNEDKIKEYKIKILLKYFSKKGFDYNSIILFLFNKYDSSLTINVSKLRSTKNEKLYTITYKFNLL